MKFVFKLLLVLALILAIFFAYISTKSNHFDVQQTKLIKAPISSVFKTVNDYKTWKDWTPWMKQDTTLVVTLNEKTVGVDSGYTWKSDKDAGGNMKTISVEDNKQILQKMTFYNSGASDVYWKFKGVKEGTQVTWGIKGDLDLIQKAAFTVVGGAELLFMKTISEGLTNLDSYVTSNIKLPKTDNYSITKNGVVVYGGQYYVGLKATCSFEELPKTLDKILPDVLIYCIQNGIKKNGAIFNIYHKYDEKNKRVEVSSCIPIKEKVKVDSKYDVELLEKGKYFKTTLKGNYSHSDEAWEKAFEYVQNEGLTMQENRKPFEVYVKGHTQAPNPEDWITEIYIPVK